MCFSLVSLFFFHFVITGEWLSDEQIDTAQYYLAINFNKVIQSTTVLEAGSAGASVGTPASGSTFVQILCLNQSHWVTVSNWRCESGTVRIYDSMKPRSLGN